MEDTSSRYVDLKTGSIIETQASGSLSSVGDSIGVVAKKTAKQISNELISDLSQYFSKYPRKIIDGAGNIAILDFEGDDIAADDLISRIGDKVKLIERNQLEKILKEQKLTLSGFLENLGTDVVGKIKGVDFLIMGSYNGDVYASRIVDVKTAMVLYGEVAENKEELAEEIMKDLIPSKINNSQINNVQNNNTTEGKYSSNPEVDKMIEKVYNNSGCIDYEKKISMLEEVVKLDPYAKSPPNTNNIYLKLRGLYLCRNPPDYESANKILEEGLKIYPK